MSRPFFACVALSALLAACGSDNGTTSTDTAFTAGKEVPDVCAMLTLADVQTLLPTATAGAPDTVSSTDDLRYQKCTWNAADAANGHVSLVVTGATQPSGWQYLTSPAHTDSTSTPVSGIGDQAGYVETTTVNQLWVLKKPYSVDISDYGVKPLPSVDQLKPLLAKLVGELP